MSARRLSPAAASRATRRQYVRRLLLRGKSSSASRGRSVPLSVRLWASLPLVTERSTTVQSVARVAGRAMQAASPIRRRAASGWGGRARRCWSRHVPGSSAVYVPQAPASRCAAYRVRVPVAARGRIPRGARWGVRISRYARPTHRDLRKLAETRYSRCLVAGTPAHCRIGCRFAAAFAGVNGNRQRRICPANTGVQTVPGLVLCGDRRELGTATGLA